MIQLIKKGDHAYFVLEKGDGEYKMNAPRGAAMLHDPDGKGWGKCSLLFLSFRHGGRAVTSEEFEGAPRDYLGKNYERRARIATITIPPRSLSSWESCGRVRQIFYNRIGTKAPGRFQHPFGERSAQMLFRRGRLPTLYRLRSSERKAMRLELGPDAIIDDRGIVFP